MRILVVLIVLCLSGCGQPKSYTSACDIPEPRRAVGSEVTFRAMLMPGNMEYNYSVSDPRCWRGFAADLRDAPRDLIRAFDTPGFYNKFATVSGRLEWSNNKPWLHITAAEQIHVNRPMSKAEEDAFAHRMGREANAWNATHPSWHPTI